MQQNTACLRVFKYQGGVDVCRLSGTKMGGGGSCCYPTVRECVVSVCGLSKPLSIHQSIHPYVPHPYINAFSHLFMHPGLHPCIHSSLCVSIPLVQPQPRLSTALHKLCVSLVTDGQEEGVDVTAGA